MGAQFCSRLAIAQGKQKMPCNRRQNGISPAVLIIATEVVGIEVIASIPAVASVTTVVSVAEPISISTPVTIVAASISIAAKSSTAECSAAEPTSAEPPTVETASAEPPAVKTASAEAPTVSQRFVVEEHQSAAKERNDGNCHFLPHDILSCCNSGSGRSPS
jgi:hypothetical protein